MVALRRKKLLINCTFSPVFRVCNCQYFIPFLTFVKTYQFLTSHTQNDEEQPKTQETISKLKGGRIKNQAKNSRSRWHLPLSHYSNFQYFPIFFQYQYQYQYQNSQNFQYQYQNQYFGNAFSNINIKINISKLQFSISKSLSIGPKF